MSPTFSYVGPTFLEVKNPENGFWERHTVTLVKRIIEQRYYVEWQGEYCEVEDSGRKEQNVRIYTLKT